MTTRFIVPTPDSDADRHARDGGTRALFTALVACIGGASLHVALALDLRLASGYLAVATLLAAALFSLSNVRLDADSAWTVASAVFTRNVAVLGAIAIAAATFEAHLRVAPSGLRAMLVAAIVFPATSAVVLSVGLALSRARRALARERLALVDLAAQGTDAKPSPAPGVESVRELVPVLVVVLVALTTLVADGAARAMEQRWSGARATFAALALGAGIAWLASLLVRWVDRRLALEREGSTLAADRRASNRLTAVRSSLAALDAHVAAGESLSDAFERERRELAADQARLAALLEASRAQDEQIERRAAELATQLERARRGLDASHASANEHDADPDSISAVLDGWARTVGAREGADGGGAATAFGRATRGSRVLGAGLAELVSLVRTLDESASSAAGFAREAVARAEQGGAKFAETSAGMEAIRAATHAAEGVIRGLGERTREIGGILDVIDDVGDQTSLLALNAAIIAAQAGEHGRAFSVVAEEIRDLADRVLASTKEIGALIRAVQSETEHAIGAIEAGSASVRRGVELSAEAGETLAEMARVSRETGERVGALVSGATSLAHALGRASDQAMELDASITALPESGTVRAAGAPNLRVELDGLRVELERRFERVRREQIERVGRAGDELAVAANAVREVAEELAAHTRARRELARAIERGEQAACAVAHRGRELAERDDALRPLLGELGARLEGERDSRGATSGSARAMGDDT